MMTIVQRALCCLWRKKGQTLTLVAFMMVLATLMLLCLSLQQAAETAEANMRKGLEGFFTINAKLLAAGLETDTVEAVLATDGLSGRYTLRSSTIATFAGADGTPLDILNDQAALVPEGCEHAGKLMARAESKDDAAFTEEGFVLSAGRHLTANDHYAVLLHEDFAARNHLALGDTLRLSDVSREGRTVQVQVAGLFTNTKPQESLGLAPSTDLYQNMIFSDLATASQLLYGTDDGAQYGDFYVNDPAALADIITDVKTIPGVDWDACSLSSSDSDYQHARSALQGLERTVQLAIGVVMLIGFLVLMLFLALRLRSRVHEAGCYLALGLTKGNVLAQFLCEAALLALLALALATLVSSGLAAGVGSTLLAHLGSGTVAVDAASGDVVAQNEALNLETVRVAVMPSQVALVGLAGLGLSLAATALASWPLLRMEPRAILSSLS